MIKANTLSAMDIELIYFLKNKLLFPKNIGELMESIKVLDEDQYAFENIMAHTNAVYNSLYDYYEHQNEDILKTILNNI